MDKELKEFSELVKPPTTFEEGFNWRTVIMALFVGLILAPAQVYIQLVAGTALGSAAQWVTVILYVEIARRAFMRLKKPEIFLLFYMCGVVVSSGGMGLLNTQFLVQSEELRKMGVTEHIPSWVAPQDPDVLAKRNFFMQAWMVPLLLMTLLIFVNRLDKFGLGYVMFRLTSDVEKLPFPMAPVSAMGMTALADASQQKDTSRWRIFSIGAMAGIAFGFIYIGVPNITGAIFAQPLQILPLPFLDLTRYTEKWLPAMPMIISFDIGAIIIGMVIPFSAVSGGFTALLIVLALNPLLYHAGRLPSWQPGIGGIQTMQTNLLDFYFSFGIGLSLAIAVIGFIHVYRSMRQRRREMGALGQPAVEWKRIFEPPAGRGDIPIWVGLAIFFFSTTLYIALAYWLVNFASGPLLGPKFPLWLLIVYGFVYTPIISYVSSRMEGMVGQTISIPYFQQLTFILSGYKGAAIWFVPIPLTDYAGQVQSFKTTELTGTKFSSLIKAEFLIFPVVVVSSLVFSQLIWSLDNVPSQMFPYANQFWELQAYQNGLFYSATLPGAASSAFHKAFKPEYIVIGLVIALFLFWSLGRWGAPTFFAYGLIGSISNATTPQTIVLMFIGALLGKYVFKKWFGGDWPQYRTVFAAGFAAGMGLITMLSLGIVFLSKSAIKLPM